MGRVRPVHQPLYAPASGKACVYVHTVVKEQVIRKEQDGDSDGIDYQYETEEWKVVVDHEQGTDFWYVYM